MGPSRKMRPGGRGWWGPLSNSRVRQARHPGDEFKEALTVRVMEVRGGHLMVMCCRCLTGSTWVPALAQRLRHLLWTWEVCFETGLSHSLAL